jgi:hypothetical protein
MVKAAPPLRVSPDTAIVWPATATLPLLEVVKPLSVDATLGVLHPGGTVSVTVPSFIPKLAAVYVKTMVLFVDPASTEAVGVFIVPAPSGGVTEKLWPGVEVEVS